MRRISRLGILRKKRSLTYVNPLVINPFDKLLSNPDVVEVLRLTTSALKESQAS